MSHTRLLLVVLFFCLSQAPTVAQAGIADVKALPDGTPVHLDSKTVVARLWGTRFYVAESDRSCGIGVISATDVSAGQIVSVDGVKTTSNGEPCITSATVTVISSGEAQRALGIRAKSILTKPEIVGLRVKTWGNVKTGLRTGDLGDYFTIGDGDSDVRVYVGNTGAGSPGIGRLVVVEGVGGKDSAGCAVLLASASMVSIQGDTYSTGQVTPSRIPEWVWNHQKAVWAWLSYDGIANAIRDGANVVCAPVRDRRHAFYPSNLVPHDIAYGDGVLLGQIISYAHSRNAKFVADIPPRADYSILTLHTDWRARPTNDTSWLTKPVDQTWGCLNSPYGDHLIEQVMEVMQMTGADGITFDGYCNDAFCYCDYCKAKYLQDTGKQIPAYVDYGSADYRQYLAWQDAQICDHMTRMQAALDAANPDFAFYIWSTNAGRYGHFLTSPRVMPTELNLLFDCSMQEWWHDETNIGSSIIPYFGLRYMSAVTRQRPWLSEPYPYTHWQDAVIGIVASSMPNEEMRHRTSATQAAGGLVGFSWEAKSPIRRSVFDGADRRNTWTYKESTLKWAAMLVSEPTRQFYGRADPVGRYLESCFGFFRALTEEHIPVDLITHTDLREGLASSYKVLILPNTACMSDEDNSAVRAFVAAGGGVVATGVTSLYDGQGVQRPDFALSDLFAAQKAGSQTETQSKAVVTDTLYARNTSVLNDFLSGGRTTSFVGKLIPVTVGASGTVLASVCRDITCSLSYPMYINNAATGAGRVAYLPASVDAAYYRYPYPYERVLMQDAVMWAANCVPPVTITAPKSVYVTCFTQNSGTRMLIHLLNTANSTAIGGAPGNEVPLREESVPVQNVRVWFENGLKPTSVMLQPNNTALALTASGARWYVTVSQLPQHLIVVAELP